MPIDNFDIIRPHLTFEPATKFDAKTKQLKELNDTYDRYIVQILKRAKDVGGKAHGVNTSNRLIKTYEISSLEYFDSKRPHIVDLCEANGARAYILPQVRSTYDCLKEIIKLGVDNLENPTIKFQHILRSALCSMHKSRDKRWIIDLDNDEMTEHSLVVDEIKSRLWTVDEIVQLVKENLIRCGKDPNDMYLVPTRNGCHLVTTPFNVMDANKNCGLIFEGVKKFPNEIVWTGPGEYEVKYKQATGWLHKDGMTILYCPDFTTL